MLTSLGAMVDYISLLAFLLGIFITGYRSCLYLDYDSIVISNLVFSYKINDKKHLISSFNSIFIDMKDSLYTDSNDESAIKYIITMVGENDLDISKYISSKRDVMNNSSWQNAMEFADRISTATNLKITFSDSVKKYNRL